MSWKKTFYEGLKSGIPIGTGVSAGLLYVWLPGGVGRSAGLGSSFYIADELNERRTVRRDKPDSGGGWVL